MTTSPKIEVIEEKPNFKDIFNMCSPMNEDKQHEQIKPTNNENNMKQTEDNKTNNITTNKQKTKPMNGGISSGFGKFKHIILLIVGSLAVLTCVVLLIYYFVTMRKSKVELLRLTSDCENYKKIADDTTSRENNIISMYETEKHELQDRIVKMEEEINRLSSERNKNNKKPKAIMKKQHNPQHRQSIPTIKEDNSDDDNPDNNDDEYLVNVPKYEEAPTSDKNKVISPAQQVKNMINGKASKNFKNKVTAIQQSNETVDNYDNEQIEYSTQLGLNKSRQINTDKLNDVINKMEKAVDDSNNEETIEDDKNINQQAVDDESTAPIDSLIVYN